MSSHVLVWLAFVSFAAVGSLPISVVAVALMALILTLRARSTERLALVQLESKALRCLAFAVPPITTGLVGAPRTDAPFHACGHCGAFAAGQLALIVVWLLAAALASLVVRYPSSGARWRRAVVALAILVAGVSTMTAAGWMGIGWTELRIPRTWIIPPLLGLVAGIALLRAAIRERRRWRGVREGQHDGNGWVGWADGTADQIPAAQDLPPGPVIVREQRRTADLLYRGNPVLVAEVWPGPLSPRLQIAYARADALSAIALLVIVALGGPLVAAACAAW